ncbi:MAG: T9SS type A sorting domain-containing protein [Prolixibacteraceae bacterium]|jgi:hypothetical protein|nr:T9SS type A sorting domain-containing protein [Prolixibacteraceae bacterium]
MKKNVSSLQCVLIALCVLFPFISTQAQTYNFIATGDMESSNWTGIPGNTNLTATFDASSGINGTTSYKTVTTSMGGDSYYILRCEEFFHMDQSDKITVSFWAKGSVADMRLQPWVQEADGNQWMNFGDAYLTTAWKQYRFTVTLSAQTSDNYKIKFRGYHTGTMYIDNVQIGPVDYENVNQSGIYEVTVSQNGMTWPLNVFRNSCPTYQLGYQNMESKDQHPLDLFSGRTINWTKFSFDDPITVHVKVIDTNKVPVSGQTVNIYPSRHSVSSSTSGNVVTFTISEPGQYSVEIGANGYKNGLMVFADPPETDIPGKSDPDFLVLYEASSNDVSSIPTSYSGVYFRRGVHNIGIWNIPSHIKDIYFEDGSWVYGALKMDGDPDVRIYGRGVLSSYNMNYRQTHCVEAINGSNRITIEGLVVADPKYFAIRLIGTDNNVSYAKVIGGWVYNCDGIAAFARSNVSKCFIWANDDAIKAYRDSISWSDIVVWQLNNGGTIQMSWGGAVGGSTAKGVTISRLDVLRAEWDVDRFNVGLLNCVGNHYQEAGRSDLIENWLIEDVVTETAIPLIWNITPDPYTHCHIDGLYMKNWTVFKDNSLGFVNEIKGEDPNDFFSGFVFDNVRFNNGLLTNENRIASGEMDNGNWVSVPNGTDHTTTFCSTCGTGSGWGLLSKTTNMNGKPYYTNVCQDEFHIDNNEMITISYWARATAAGKLLTPFVQDVVTGDIKEFPQVSLTTNFTRYASTVQVDQSTSDRYKVKFRGFSTAWIYLDKVQVGRKDWITLTDIEKQYLDTPTFLPELKSAKVNTGIAAVKNEFEVYPNPVSDVLFIHGMDENIRYKVFSQTGSLLLSGQGNQVKVSKLNAGMYILVTDDNNRVKFVKQ